MNNQQELSMQSIDFLLIKTLSRLGCHQYEVGEDENGKFIHFFYYGAQFVARIQTSQILTIFYAHCTYIELHDVDEFERMRKATNLSNQKSLVTTFYTIDETRNKVDVHSKFTLLFIPQISNIEWYLKIQLYRLLGARRFINAEMENMRAADIKVECTNTTK